MTSKKLELMQFSPDEIKLIQKLQSPVAEEDLPQFLDSPEFVQMLDDASPAEQEMEEVPEEESMEELPEE